MSAHRRYAHAAGALADWLRLASSGGVVWRACVYAAVVGPLLIAINHGQAVLDGQLGAGRVWQMGLTVLVPYLVSTFSSVGAMRSESGSQNTQQ